LDDSLSKLPMSASTASHPHLAMTVFQTLT
jgi:hypothetical protein